MITDTKTCSPCDSLPGYTTDNYGNCIEICGDGVDKGQYQCDDGNLLNGDGCSDTCQVEVGYVCENGICREVTPPSGRISYVSPRNILTINFTEPVVIKDFDQFQKSLRVDILGPLYYNYDFQVYDPGNATKDAGNITEFKLRIFNIKTHLYGSNRETIRIEIKNASLIEDLNGNILSQNSFVGSLNKFEYISEDTLRNVDTMGGSVEISIILVFVVNLLFQLSMSSSDSFMWSLIHSLQIIRYIFLVNVKVPQIFEVFIKYLAITIGEVDKIYGFIPNWFSTYVVDTSELTEGVIIGEKFAENGYIFPF